MTPIIDHLNRYVSDIEKHILFYKNILNYELLDYGFKLNGMKYAILKGYNHELFISEKKDFIIDNNNFRHVGYSVENIDELLKIMKMNGYADENIFIIEKTYSRQFYIKDPDGFEIDLIQWTDKTRFYEDLNNKNRFKS
jgi:predicted enzyme related to lactoylglutathione lyase